MLNSDAQGPPGKCLAARVLNRYDPGRRQRGTPGRCPEAGHARRAGPCSPMWGRIVRRKARKAARATGEASTCSKWTRPPGPWSSARCSPMMPTRPGCAEPGADPSVRSERDRDLSRRQLRFRERLRDQPLQRTSDAAQYGQLRRRRPRAISAFTPRASTCWWPTTPAGPWPCCRWGPTASSGPRATSRPAGATIGPARAASAPPGSFAISGHERPHAHMIESDPAGRFVLASDLGRDRIFIWKFDASQGPARGQRPAAGRLAARRRAAAFRFPSQRPLVLFAAGRGLDGRRLRLRRPARAADGETDDFQPSARIRRHQFHVGDRGHA